jgi:hypothetical protein
MAIQRNLASFSVTPRSKQGGGWRGTVRNKSDKHTVSENFIDIKFIAGFRQFAAFMNALERHHPVLFIDEFSITRSFQDGFVYQASLDVTAFVREQKDNETADMGQITTYSAKL